MGLGRLPAPAQPSVQCRGRRPFPAGPYSVRCLPVTQHLTVSCFSLPMKKTRQVQEKWCSRRGREKAPMPALHVSNRWIQTQGQVARRLRALFLWPQHRAEHPVVSIRGERPQPREEPRGRFHGSFPVFRNEESPMLPLVPCVFKSPDSAGSLVYQLVITRSVFTMVIWQNREGRAPLPWRLQRTPTLAAGAPGSGPRLTAFSADSTHRGSRKKTGSTG